MDKQQFIKTRQAVADLQAELKNLKQAAESKKYALTQQRQSYKHNMAERNLRLENLTKAVADMALKTDATIQKIEMVLNEDGSGNNNN